MMALDIEVTNNGVRCVFTPAKKAHAQFCYCETCDTWLGCQYWPLSKSAAMHERGTGHKVKFYALKDTRG